MRSNGFARSILFGLVAAAASLPWLFFTERFLVGRTALGLYLVVAVAAYLAGLATDRRRRLAVFGVAAIAGCVVLLLAHSLTEIAVGLAVILAVGRSGVLYRAATARAVFIEAALGAGGLVFARFLAARSPEGVFLAIWAFFLVQSLYFLIGGVRVRTRASRVDPFEEAHRRALALLAGE
jgi:hypothetical protein